MKAGSYKEASNGDPKGRSYSEHTPTFESLQSGNAGRGVQGIKHYSVGAQEYDRKKHMDAASGKTRLTVEDKKF